MNMRIEHILLRSEAPLGRMALRSTSISNNTPIDISGLSTGSYTVHVRTAKGEGAMAKWLKP
jgi:hypothetical protein